MGLTKLPYKQWSDKSLVTRVAQGDVHALEALYDRYSAIIFGIALKMTGDEALAETVLQETFWRLWQDVPAYQPERLSFPGWLFRMARGLSIDACEQQSFHSQGTSEQPGYSEEL